MAKSRAQKAKAYSLLGHYHSVRQGNHVAAIAIEDPYASVAHIEASAVSPPRGAVTDDGPAEWQAPARPRIKVMTSTRADVVAGMYARHQIDEAMFAAARSYQATYERAAATQRVSAIDLAMPPISGGRGGDFQGADMVLRAGKELKRVEKALGQHVGDDGLSLVREYPWCRQND
jgi:hypothetical protein